MLPHYLLNVNRYCEVLEPKLVQGAVSTGKKAKSRTFYKPNAQGAALNLPDKSVGQPLGLVRMDVVE
jgi:hypothetical protein